MHPGGVTVVETISGQNSYAVGQVDAHSVEIEVCPEEGTFQRAQSGSRCACASSRRADNVRSRDAIPKFHYEFHFGRTRFSTGIFSVIKR